jgi:hypothetical protein
MLFIAFWGILGGDARFGRVAYEESSDSKIQA